MQKYKFLEHTADIKFQAFGKSLEEVFSNCAYAMFNSICSVIPLFSIPINTDSFLSGYE